MKAQEQKSSMEQKEEKKDKPPNQNLIGLHKKKKNPHIYLAIQMYSARRW